MNIRRFNRSHSLACFLITLLSVFFLSEAVSTARQQSGNDRSVAEILSSARVVFIQGRSGFFDREALERELLKHPDFRAWELTLTKNIEAADLVAEITRKKFTTRFTIRLIDPRSEHVIAAEQANSLGGTIEPKLADRLVKLLRPYRP